jgi:hypothetical protein
MERIKGIEQTDSCVLSRIRSDDFCHLLGDQRLEEHFEKVLSPGTRREWEEREQLLHAFRDQRP